MDITRGAIEYIGELPFPVFLFCGAVCYVIYCSITTPRNLPMGPFAWPVIGNMWDYTRQKAPLGETLERLRGKYGAIFRIYYGRHLIVIISGSSGLAEVCSKNGVFCRMPSWQWMTDRLHRQTVGRERWFNNDTWLAMLKRVIDCQEKTTLCCGLETRILTQVKLVKGNLIKRSSNGVLLGQLIDASMEDIICDVMLGSKLEFKRALHVLFPQCNFQDGRLPSIRVLPDVEKDALQRLILDGQSRDNINNVLTNHHATYRPDTIRDFTDLFIKIQLERKSTHSSEAASYLQDLSHLLLTTPAHVACVLQWAFLLVIAHPNVQRKCQEELDMFVGLGEEILFSDKTSLPYVRATVCEVKRLANIMTLSLPYATTKATSVGGYSIPKDTVILFDLRPVLEDPVTYTHPDKFKPERHLNIIGQFSGLETVIDRHESCHVIDELSEMITFLFFVNVLQEFTLTKLDGDVLNLEYDRDASPCPAPYNVIATRR